MRRDFGGGGGTGDVGADRSGASGPGTGSGRTDVGKTDDGGAVDRRRTPAGQRPILATDPSSGRQSPAGPDGLLALGDARRRGILAGALVAGLLAAGTFPSVTRAEERTLLVVGDSLSAEYGLARGEGWVALLGARLASVPEGRNWRIVNASISGDTTAGGLARLPALLERQRPAITVIELGGNDALRGLSLAVTEANLRKMVQLARAAGSRPLLIGMEMPPNYGPAYARQFSDLFRRVADAEQIPLVPFLLAGFGDDTGWFQPDRIHPAAKAQPRMLDNVWPTLRPML